MKKFITALAFVCTFYINGIAQLKLPKSGDGIEKDSLATQPKQFIENGVKKERVLSTMELKNWEVIKEMKIERQPLEKILHALHPVYRREELEQFATSASNLFNAGFTASELLTAIKQKYNLRIGESIYVLYMGYKASKNGRLDATSWAYDFQVLITNSYHTNSKPLEQFLKEEGSPNFRAYQIFYVVGFYLWANVNVEIKNRFFENLMKIGFSPAEIFQVTERYIGMAEGGPASQQQIEYWTPFYCTAMKRTTVPAKLVASILSTDFHQPEIINYLKLGGYTASEIMGVF